MSKSRKTVEGTNLETKRRKVRTVDNTKKYRGIYFELEQMIDNPYATDDNLKYFKAVQKLKAIYDDCKEQYPDDFVEELDRIEEFKNILNQNEENHLICDDMIDEILIYRPDLYRTMPIMMYRYPRYFLHQEDINWIERLYNSDGFSSKVDAFSLDDERDMKIVENLALIEEFNSEDNKLLTKGNK